jgi:hypothetical protein
VWPALARARGTTFVGVFEGATPSTEGNTTFHWTVERVYAGPLNAGPLDGWGIGYGCHATGYREGKRYLVSSRYPGGATAFDTVAYELLGGGRVRLARFPEQPRWSAPRVYRSVDSLREALDLLVRGRLPKRSGSEPGPGPSFEPSTAGQAKDDLLVLSIATDRVRVVADEPIAITTTLRYVGTVKNQYTRVSGPSGSLVAFGVEQIDGPIDTGPGWRPESGYYRFEPDEVLDIPFAKSGGFEADGPMADFWRAWFADPVLRLPEGHYLITAYAYHCGRGAVCRGPWKGLTASVAIQVAPAPGASPSPVANASETPPTSTSEPTADGSTGGLLPPGETGQTDVLDRWGPLAVIEGGGGPDARTGHGTLSIGTDCVTFTADQTDEAVTLVWGSGRTSWRPEKRLIVYTDSPNGTTRLSDGDRVWFGGMAIAAGGESMLAWLEGVWVQRPDPSCPTRQWLVGDVNLLE